MENIKILAFEINSAIHVCEARIDNGAEISAAFDWLREELKEVYNGETPYIDEAKEEGWKLDELIID